LLCAFGEKNGALPPYERFYFGGAYSVRGYEYNYARGDRFFLTGLEYRFNILRPMLILPKLDLGLGGALFWDGGMVWNSGQDLKAIPWYSSCGGGLRFFIPILEVMRLDIAWHPQSKYYLDLAVGMKF
jgi:outer membrane protein assembly factor BamA